LIDFTKTFLAKHTILMYWFGIVCSPRKIC
jgi:hypothetical protein